MISQYQHRINNNQQLQIKLTKNKNKIHLNKYHFQDRVHPKIVILLVVRPVIERGLCAGKLHSTSISTNVYMTRFFILFFIFCKRDKVQFC